MRSALRIIVFLAAALVLSISTPASAQITAFWQQNTITPQAIAADPALANMQSWSVWATTTGDWASGAMNAYMPLGLVYYNPSIGGDTRPSAATIAMFPHVEFDTYVTGPGDLGGGVGAPILLGMHAGAPGPADLGGTTGRFSPVWGNLSVDPPGTFEIARLTFPQGLLPNIPIGPNPSQTSQVNPDSSTIILPIPEPMMTALGVSAALLVLRWRPLQRTLVGALVLVGALIPTSASAQITAFWQQNTITPQAIAADPTLANMQSWSLMATTTGNWAYAGMEAILPAGPTFYNPPLSGNTSPNPALVSVFPYLAFDTYITAPSDFGLAAAPKIFGSFPETGPGTADFGGISGRFSVAWGELVNDAPGTYEIARLTFALGTFPEVRNLTPPQASPSLTMQETPDANTIIPDIPEPHALGLLLGAALLAMSRCRSMPRMAALFAIVLLLFLSTPASAQITAFWQPNTITPQAIAADSTLANMQSWSLMATTTGNWLGAGMEAMLPAGNVFYNPTAGGRTKPSAGTIAMFPNVEFDTYATSPADQGGGVGAPAILGGHYASPVADFGETSGRFDVAWGDLVVDPPGTYEIARLTFPAGVIADVTNGPFGFSVTSQAGPDSTTIIPDIPEPNAMGSSLLSGALLLPRRSFIVSRVSNPW